MLLTTLVGIFIHEKDNEVDGRPIRINIFQSYKLLWEILNLPNMRVLILALLTMKVNTAQLELTENILNNSVFLQ